MDLGKTLIIVGFSLVVLGALFRYAPWMVTWFGRLPGDVHYEGPSTSVFIPISTMILVSIVGSIALNLIGRLFGGK